MWKLLIMVIAIVIKVECADSNSNTTGSPYTLTACSGALESWRRAVISYTGKSMKELIASKKNDTVLGAPLDFLYALTHLANFLTGQRLHQVLRLLGVKNKDEIRCILKEIFQYHKGLPPGIEYYLSTNFFVDNRHKFTDDFKQQLTNSLSTKTVNIDLSSVNASGIINAIIANDTHNKVLNTVDPNMINKRLSLNIINGVYYDINPYMFWYKNISIGNYRASSNQSYQTIFGYRTGIYNYTESAELDAKVIRIPLKDGTFHAVIFLSNREDGFDKMVHMLGNGDLVAKIWDSFKLVSVTKSTPIFTSMENVVDTRQILKEFANISSIFKSKQSSFIVNKKSTSLTLAKQKVVLEYGIDNDSDEEPDDEGCPADSNKYEFIADRPVVIYIVRNCLRVPALCYIGKPIRI